LGCPDDAAAADPARVLTRDDAEAMSADGSGEPPPRGALHPPRPAAGDAFPKVAGDTDNSRRRNGTLDMQASLSS